MRIFYGVLGLGFYVFWVGYLFFEWEVNVSYAASLGALALAVIFLDKARKGKD